MQETSLQELYPCLRLCPISLFHFSDSEHLFGLVGGWDGLVKGWHSPKFVSHHFMRLLAPCILLEKEEREILLKTYIGTACGLVLVLLMLKIKLKTIP